MGYFDRERLFQLAGDDRRSSSHCPLRSACQATAEPLAPRTFVTNPRRCKHRITQRKFTGGKFKACDSCSSGHGRHARRVSHSKTHDCVESRGIPARPISPPSPAFTSSSTSCDVVPTCELSPSWGSFLRAFRDDRSFPSAVFGPVESPPCHRQRPLAYRPLCGQGSPVLLPVAPQRRSVYCPKSIGGTACNALCASTPRRARSATCLS